MKLTKKTKNKLLFIVPLLLIVAFIFSLSYQQAEKSTTSKTINTQLIQKNNNEVTLIFWSQCPACYNLDNQLKMWKSNKSHIKINMIPAAGNNWDFEARMFYSIQSYAKINYMNLFNQYFNFIHNNQGFKSEKMKLDFVASLLNISNDKLNDILYSDDINTKLDFSRTITRELNINSVPQIIVEGTHLLNMQSFNNYKDLFNEIESILRNN